MIPSHLLPPHHPAQTPTASSSATGPAWPECAPAPGTDLHRQLELTIAGAPDQPAAAVATFEQRLSSPQDLQRRAPGWLAGPPHSQRAATGIKRRLTPPPPPAAHRPWPGTVAGQATWSHASLQQHAQAEQAISDTLLTSLAHLGMDWSALNAEQQQDLWNAASSLAHAPAQTHQQHREHLDALLLQTQVQHPTPTAVAYSDASARSHWRSRCGEFGLLLVEWRTVTGKKPGGAKLLQRLSALCDAELNEGRGTQVDDDGLVFEFSVTLEPGMAAQRIWRRLDENGVPNLRLAPAPDDAQASANLLKQMQAAAKQSASRRQEAPAATVYYDKRSARNNWKSHSGEFGPLLAEWDKKTHTPHSPAMLLQRLSALCDAELNEGRGTQVDDDGLVFEFSVTLEPGMEVQRIWRRLDENGVPNLRLAPAPDDAQASANLLKQMQAAAKQSASRRQEAPAATVYYDKRSARNNWKSHGGEFGPLLAEWDKKTHTTHSPAMLLQRLSALCDQGRGKQVDADGLVFEFSVTLEPGMEVQRIWRRLDENGVPNLRLAPAPDDAQASVNLLKKMQSTAKRSASQRKK